jgi:hypothetical protein
MRDIKTALLGHHLIDELGHHHIDELSKEPFLCTLDHTAEEIQHRDVLVLQLMHCAKRF